MNPSLRLVLRRSPTTTRIHRTSKDHVQIQELSSIWTPQLRYFASKKNKNKKNKKKLTMPPPNNYGTPKTGLIVPSSSSLDNNAPLGSNSNSNSNNNSNEMYNAPSSLLDGTKQFFSAQQPIQESNDLYSPLLDQSLSSMRSKILSSSTTSSSPSPSLSSERELQSSLLFNHSNHNNNNNENDENNLFLNNIVDQTSMYNPTIHLPNKPNFSNPVLNYEPGTELGEEIMKYIAVNGSPITVAEYMKRCLQDEQFGYYTNPPSSSSESSSTFSDEGDEDGDKDDDMDMIENDNAANPQRQGKGHRLIGQHGDFTTAPEISQIFGECITIWLLTQYEQLNKPSKIQLVELGPGRGTLMCDILRSASSIKGVGHDFIDALCSRSSDSDDSDIDNDGSGSGNSNNQAHGVHFVEVSENLRITQREALEAMNVKDNKMTSNNNNNIDFEFCKWETKKEREERVAQIMNAIREKKTSGKEVDDELLKEIVSEQRKQNMVDDDSGSNSSSSSVGLKSNSIPINWHDNFNDVPFQMTSASDYKNEGNKESIPTFIVCQEFFDALPVHVFQKTQDGWRERLVDVAIEEDEEEDEEGSIHSTTGNSSNSNRVQVKLMDGTTASVVAPASSSPSNGSQGSIEDSTQKKKTRFRFVLSPDVTPALRTLLRIDSDGKAPAELDDAPIGTIMEVSPEALTLVQDLALRIDECKGAALIIDYGNEGSKDTLRAFQKHEQVDVLSSPGKVDITADVDFTAMKNAVNVDMNRLNKKGNKEIEDDKKIITEAFGPKTQGGFLSSMGAVERTIQLIEDDNTTDDQAEDLCTALERLVSSEEMGERFKVLAIARKKDEIFSPPGF